MPGTVGYAGLLARTSTGAMFFPLRARATARARDTDSLTQALPTRRTHLHEMKL